MLFRPLPVEEPRRLAVFSRATTTAFSYHEYREFRDASQAFSELAASFPWPVGFGKGAECAARTSRRIKGSLVGVDATRIHARRQPPTSRARRENIAESPGAAALIITRQIRTC